MLQADKTDEELMAKYQEGSEEAFHMLYKRHSGKIFGYLKSRVRSEQLSQDLFQEVFLKLHKSKGLYNKSLPVLPWIFSVTHSVMIDGLRQRNKKHEVQDFDFDRLPQNELEEQNISDVVPFIKRLPNQQQIALQMRYVDDKTFEDIARKLKTSPLNARQILSRSVRQLKEIVRGEKS